MLRFLLKAVPCANQLSSVAVQFLGLLVYSSIRGGHNQDYIVATGLRHAERIVVFVKLSAF